MESSPRPAVAPSVLDLVGDTPLIRLRGVSEETGCDILGKAEFLNPGQSVKDRAALWMVRDAEARGLLRPGGTIVEGTAGNTGIGLALVAKALGYDAVIVIPDTQSAEKKLALRAAGATLIEVPALPYRNPDNYVKLSGRLAAQLDRERPAGAFWANQFDNVANRQAHLEGTGPEILRQTGGHVHGFVASVGTGGTLAGTAMALKAADPTIRIAAADPPGSAIFSWVTAGTLDASGSSVTEGIGQGRVTANLDGAPIDGAYKVPDAESIGMVFRLLDEEGLCLGGSSGVNVVGAVRLARDLGPGNTIVTVLCDYGQRYASKLFDPAFLAAKDLPVPDWLARPPAITMPFEGAAA